MSAETDRHIVVAVDLSDQSLKAVQYTAYEFCKPGDVVHLVHVAKVLSPQYTIQHVRPGMQHAPISSGNVPLGPWSLGVKHVSAHMHQPECLSSGHRRVHLGPWGAQPEAPISHAPASPHTPGPCPLCPKDPPTHMFP